MSELVYLLDNNVLIQLGKDRVTSTFVRTHCRVPDEVIHEAGDAAHAGALRGIAIPVDMGVLSHLISVMSALEPGDFDVVDLYRNQGNGDPLLVATVLAAREKESETLFVNEWVIATEDKAVRRLAERFGVPSIGIDELIELVEAHDA